jgi:hypothetical protein
MAKPTQKELWHYFDYDPETGLFYIRVRRRGSYLQIGDQVGCKQSINKHLMYLMIVFDKKRYLAHHLAWVYMTGKWPKQVDHLDGNPLNNAWDNLREVTQSQNMRNAKKAKHNQSGCTGVSWDKKRHKWRVQVCNKHIGHFEEFDDACTARRIAEKLEGGFTTRHGTVN